MPDHLRHILSHIILCCSLLSRAQIPELTDYRYELEHQITNSNFTKIKLGGTSEEIVRNYLRNELEVLNNEQVQLQLQHNIESPAGFHFTYMELINGTPVYNSQVKANVDKNGRLYALFELTFGQNEVVNGEFPNDQALSLYLEKNLIDTASLEKFYHERIYFPYELTLIPAMYLEILTLEESYEVIINDEGEPIFFRDLIQYRMAEGVDSLVNASVFLPDPLTSANVTYGAPYLDYNDSNLAVLNAEMASVTIKVDYDNGVFSLEGPYVKITNYKNPGYSPATSTTPFFNYNRAEQEFEDINVYYHIHVYQEYIQSLGFTNLANYQIHAESHAYETDNSTFVGSFNPPRLNFGEGGVDDGEDADVIIHEYCHAVQRSAAPNSNSGFERKALDEGNSDYFAASYSRSLSGYNWGSVFSWDGHNEFYSGRIVNSNKHYPDELNGSFHSNGEIWSSALMEIWGVIGQTTLDQIVLQSIYDYSDNMSMSQAAMLVILADSNLNNGANFQTICEAFNARGFATICNNFAGVKDINQNGRRVELANSELFANGQFATIRFNFLPQNGNFVLTDISGREIRKVSLKKQREFNISSEGLNSGIYLLSIQTEGNLFSFKLLKY